MEENTMSTNEASTKAGEYMAFILGGEEYGVDILNVQEVKAWSQVRELPNMPDYLLGVMDLRGTIVPIVDMRKRFGLEDKELTAMTVVIILHCQTKNGEKVSLGITVDAVSEVYQIREEQLREAPPLGSNIDARFIDGMANIEDKLLVLINLNELLDVHALHQIAQQSV